jgi:hypothetical protein
MKITEESIKSLPISDYEKRLLNALLQDLKEINHNLPLRSKELYLDWIDTHTEYSPERVDPCPDYYGMYRIWRGDDYIGVEMDLDTLDSALCLLYNFVIEDD